MNKFMDVGDVFESKEHGTVVVGVNPALAYLNKIGGSIVLRTPEGEELVLKVVSVQVSNSPTDTKRVGLCLGQAIPMSEIPIGSEVYTVS